MPAPIIAKFEDLRSVAFGSIGASYAPIGDPFGNPIRLMKVDNLTDGNLLFSMNGADDHFVVPAMSGVIYDVSTNRVDNELLLFRKGIAIHVKRLDTPTAGSVYVTLMYASEASTP